MTAPSDKTAARDLSAQSADSLIRRLARRYVLVLTLVAALVAIDQAVIQPLLVRLNSYAPAINVAGRQRMLSQRLTKAALALQAATIEERRRFRRDELSATLTQWSIAHVALLQGSQPLAVAKLDDPHIARAMADLEPHFQAMCAAARELLEHPALVKYARTARQSEPDPLAQAVDAIVDHEADYLPVMDHVVKLLEDESGRHVMRLRIYGLSIASAVIALLLVLGWLVVRPATRSIRGQVDELESRVAQRTAELAETNRALEHEIRQREQAESKTQRLAAQLAHAARVSTMGHFTAGLAHEINQPLAAIANFAETCELLTSRRLADSHPAGDTRLQAGLAQIKQAAFRAGQIVRRLRNFVRPNNASMTEVDLNVLIREVGELCCFEAEREEVRLLFDLAARHATVVADPIQIQQVLVNLLQNSFHAMRACPPDKRSLLIRTADVEPNVQVAVIDSGPGFAGADLHSLFAPFYTTKPDGLGIGLAICRSIVERHDGAIWAQSPPQGGATVLFHLPGCRLNDAPAPEQIECICR